MYIKTCDFHGENEASVLVSDGHYEILSYAHPFENRNGATFTLSAFMENNTMRALDNTYFVEKSAEGYYAYRLQGKLIDLKKRLVAIGKIIIELEDDIPKDIEENEFIEFTVMRIDLFEN